MAITSTIQRQQPLSASSYHVVKERQMVPDPDVLDFLPATAVPPLPIQLVCKSFGTFLDNVRNNRLPPPTKDDFKHFADLVAACSSFYDDGGLLREELRKIWKDYLCVMVQDEMFTGSANMGGVSRTDLSIRDPVYDALVWLAEVKRGFSTCRTEPLMQALLNYRLNWFNARVREKELFSDTYCPVLILQHVGQLLQVGAACMLPIPNEKPGKEDKVCYQPLGSVQLVPIHGHDLSTSMEGVRMCMAIKAAVQELLQLYLETGRMNERDGPDAEVQAFLRKWIPTPLLADALEAGYVKQLVEKKLVYGLGRPGETHSCIVKYCQRYGDRVHLAWAEAGFAPKLLSVENLAGGWKEVRMEWLAKEEGWELLYDLEEEEADALRNRVVGVLKAAHCVPVGVTPDQKPTFGVHGDMRDTNVMVRTKEDWQFEVRFLDFEWATEEGEEGSCYPPFMNTHINWPVGVAASQAMRQTHDVSLLQLKQARQTSQPDLNRAQRRQGTREERVGALKRRR